MLLAVLLLIATGYLSYRNLSSIVSSIPIDVRPERILLNIREISTDLEHAENSVRIYMITDNSNDLESYYTIINNIDKKVRSLQAECQNDSGLMIQVDTISKLIEENIANWTELLYLSRNDTVDEYLKKLSGQLAASQGTDKDSEKGILKRVFSRNKNNQLDDQMLATDLERIEMQDSITKERLMTRESQLAVTGGEIRGRFYEIISVMEKDILSLIDAKASSANLLAGKTYRWLAMFSVAGTLLAILILFLVVRFVRKSHAYQIALESSKAEAEKLARTKETFMANMSHEIRTPVTAISGFTEQLLHETYDPNTSRLLRIIKSSSDHLGRIIDDILDFSKLQNEKLILEKVHFDIRNVVEDVYTMFERKAQQNNTKLSYDLSPDMPPVLLGDPYRLRQIMMNLISNAVKFTRDGEVQFNIRSDNKPVSYDKQPGEIGLLMEFIDTGIGIDESKLDSIFEDFTQGEVSTARKYGGTGLGLSIVKKLVELHKGSIECKSKKNHGTTITCRIPYLIGDEKQIKRDIEPHISVPEEIRKLKVLIVDDEEYNRLLFKTILDRWNVRYDLANSGVEALDMIKASHYDLLFMDVRMPGIDGFRITQFIRNELNIKSSEMPVICISAVSLNLDWQKYKESGMDAYLPKPFTEEILMTTILSVKKGDGSSEVADTNSVETMVESGPEQINLHNLYHISGGDEQFIKQMLITFIDSTQKGLNAMDKALASGKLENIADLVHKMLPPCRHIGAKRLYNHLKSIEDNVKNKAEIEVLQSLARQSTTDFESLARILNSEIAKFN